MLPTSLLHFSLSNFSQILFLQLLMAYLNAVERLSKADQGFILHFIRVK